MLVLVLILVLVLHAFILVFEPRVLVNVPDRDTTKCGPVSYNNTT